MNPRIIHLPNPGTMQTLKTTLTHGDFVADVYTDTKGDAVLYHYIITTRDNAEIIFWGQERSYDAAINSAKGHMGSIAKKRGATG